MENTKYYIFEREVDKKTFDKYKNQTFDIGGKQRNLLGVSVWATSREIAEACPEEAAEARVIYDRILSEIGKAAPKKTFHSFLEDLQTIYREEVANYNAVHNAFDTAKKEYDATMTDYTAPKHIKIIASGDFERAKMTFEQDQLKAQDRYNSRVSELRQRMANFVEDVYRAKPERIDQSAMQLLNTGIMSADEMDYLADQFRNNPTMMRIIGQYALKKADTFSNADSDKAMPYIKIGRTLSSITDSSVAMGAFDQMADFGRDGLGKNLGIARSHEKNWDRLYNEACDVYDNFIVQPGGSEE